MAVNSCRSINDLPVDCIASILSLMTPKDACCMSAVDSTLRLAAESDSVWERFLPSDYRYFISRSVGSYNLWPRKFQSKKDLYLRLSDHPILIDFGSKSFRLEKRSGKKCFMLSAKHLSIPEAKIYRWNFHPNSRFSSVAELRRSCRLEIHILVGTNWLTSGTNYAAYLVFMTVPGDYGLNHFAAEACVGITGHEMDKRSVHLCPDEAQWREYGIIPLRYPGSSFSCLSHRRSQLDGVAMVASQREDGWIEVELGEYFVKGGEDDVEISLLGVDGPSWRRGDLIIQGIEIRPKEPIFRPYQCLSYKFFR